MNEMHLHKSNDIAYEDPYGDNDWHYFCTKCNTSSGTLIEELIDQRDYTIYLLKQVFDKLSTHDPDVYLPIGLIFRIKLLFDSIKSNKIETIEGSIIDYINKNYKEANE